MDTLAPGSQLGAYRIVRPIGVGGMGEVYEAVHQRLNKPVALKVMHGARQDPAAKLRFLREGENAARVRHINIVDTTDVGEENGVPYLVMELLQGESLGAKLLRDGALEIQEVCDLMVAVCAAVQAAHSAGIIHRDIKPDNIFLTKPASGRTIPKVVDFGISKALDREGVGNLTLGATFIGSPQYSSPERARGKKEADERCDQYSLGVVTYECLAGQQPFGVFNSSLFELMEAIIRRNHAPLSVRCPKLPVPLVRAVERAMEAKPEDRFESVSEFARELAEFASPRIRDAYEKELAGPHPRRSLLPSPPLIVEPTPPTSSAQALGPVARTVTEDLSGALDETLVSVEPRAEAGLVRGSPSSPAARLWVLGGLAISLLAIGLLAVFRASSPPATPDGGPAASTTWRDSSNPEATAPDGVSPAITQPGQSQPITQGTDEPTKSAAADSAKGGVRSSGSAAADQQSPRPESLPAPGASTRRHDPGEAARPAPTPSASPTQASTAKAAPSAADGSPPAASGSSDEIGETPTPGQPAATSPRAPDKLPSRPGSDNIDPWEGL